MDTENLYKIMENNMNLFKLEKEAEYYGIQSLRIVCIKALNDENRKKLAEMKEPRNFDVFMDELREIKRQLLKRNPAN